MTADADPLGSSLMLDAHLPAPEDGLSGAEKKIVKEYLMNRLLFWHIL